MLAEPTPSVTACSHKSRGLEGLMTTSGRWPRAGLQMHVPWMLGLKAAHLLALKLPVTWLASENVMSNVPE